MNTVHGTCFSLRDPGDGAAVIACRRAHEPACGGFVAKAMDGVADADDLERVEAEAGGSRPSRRSLDAERGCQRVRDRSGDGGSSGCAAK